jgi:hypothetical protein
MTTVATAASPLGNYEIAACCAVSRNYQINYVSGFLSVIPHELLIVADDQTKELSDPLPVLTASYFGLVNGDTGTVVAPDLTTTATAGSPVGTYPITVCCASDPNYEISYRNGTLTIVDTRVTPEIAWDDPDDIVYGTLLSAVQLNAVAVYAGEEVEGSYLYAPPDGTLLDAGNGQVLSVLFTPNDSRTYSKATKSVSINVIPRGITGTFTAADKEYDGTVAAQVTAYSLIGVLAGDEGRVSLTGGAAHFLDPDVGTGKPVIGTGMLLAGSGAGNYRIERIEPDEADIWPRNLEVIAEVADKVYDGTTKADIVSIVLDRLVKGDQVGWLGGTVSFLTPDAGQNKPVKVSGITITGTDLRNYSIQENHATTANIWPLEVGASVSSDKEVYTLLAETVTLTAVVEGGAPLVAGGPGAAMSVTFRVNGQVMTDASGNFEIPLVVDPGGRNLVAELSFPVYMITSVGTVVPGLKRVEADFNRTDSNFEVVPNPVFTEFRYEPVFELLVYPNPSPGEVNFRVTMDTGSRVILNLYTITGQFITKLLDEFIPSNGTKVVTYTSTMAHTAQGVYYYRCYAGRRLLTGKVVIIPQFE